jgi:hypothetical protein
MTDIHFDFPATFGQVQKAYMYSCSECGRNHLTSHRLLLVKAKRCTCYKRRYCSVICQRRHWHSHKTECLQARAELAAIADLVHGSPEQSQAAHRAANKARAIRLQNEDILMYFANNMPLPLGAGAVAELGANLHHFIDDTMIIWNTRVFLPDHAPVVDDAVTNIEPADPSVVPEEVD